MFVNSVSKLSKRAYKHCLQTYTQAVERSVYVVSFCITPFGDTVVCPETDSIKSVARVINILLRQPCGMKRGFPIDPLLFHNSALPLFSCKVCRKPKITGTLTVCECVWVCECACVCVCVCHTWTTCWCPALRASQSSARTSCVTCATTHIVCEKVTELSLEEWLGDPALFIDWHCVPVPIILWSIYVF